VFTHQLVLVRGDGRERRFRVHERLVLFGFQVHNGMSGCRLAVSLHQVYARLILVHWVQHQLWATNRYLLSYYNHWHYRYCSVIIITTTVRFKWNYDYWWVNEQSIVSSVKSSRGQKINRNRVYAKQFSNFEIQSIY